MDKNTNRLSTKVAWALGPCGIAAITARGAMLPKRVNRRGLAITELVVAATLLITALSLVVTLSFHTGKLWQDSRHYKLAVEELTNQLEQLTILDEADLDAALVDLSPSEAVQAALPQPRLSGKKVVDDDGTRVMLEIQWARIGKAEPLTLVGWLAPNREDQR